MANKYTSIVILCLVLVFLGGAVLLQKQYRGDEKKEVTSFEECMAAGYLVMESYPRQCRTSDGRVFAEDVTDSLDGKRNFIRVFRPEPNAVITSPLVIEGEARGTWFFEASFPIVLTDWDGKIIAQGHAEAQDEWMTENFVPFKATLTFTVPAYGERGFLILQKDNPSGLPEHDDSLEMPIKFGAKAPVVEEDDEGRERDGCIITGCSGQVCADHDVVTTCELKPEYACYQDAVCERQSDKQCGWTLTAAIGRCLQELESGSDGELR